MQNETQEQSKASTSLVLKIRALWAVTTALALFAGALWWHLLYPAHPPSSAPPPLPLAYPFLASPHFDERPPGATIDTVVVHATAIDSLEESVSYFMAPTTVVSAHFVVGRDGAVVQLVPVEKRAWHAGQSKLNGAEHVNDFSVGIELVNMNDGVDGYPEVQYHAAAGIIRLLRSRYTIADDKILSHAEVATPPGRKTDPRGFDLSALRAITRSNTIWSLPTRVER
jgi:N-acetylmuramoyl-L-alanine amidase